MNSPIRIKTFRSKTLQDAFQQIRTEFGPDASILETKAARYGIFGRSRIEVTASNTTKDLQPSETDQNLSDFIRQPEQNQNSEPENSLASSTVESDQGSKIADHSGQNYSGQNYNDSMAAPIEFDGPERVTRQVHQELIDAGLAPAIARQWIEATRFSNDPAIMQDVWTLRSELQSLIRDLVHVAPPVDMDDSRQQVIALVGPSGAGKTTTLAKLAASLSMQRGLSVGVLSIDSLCLGSNHLLQNCADVFGWHLDFVDTIEQVPLCMEGFAGCRFVLIDTCGCSPADAESIDRVNPFLTATKPTETHLVIPSTCNVRSFLRYEQGFERLNPNRMILTRLDESGGLGEFFSCLQSSSLPISYLSHGPRIPSDLIQATGIRLAQQIMAVSQIPD